MRIALDRRHALVALFTLAALSLGLFAPSTLNDGDTWWHVKVGEWILTHGQAPSVDLWSATRTGQPWTAHEWLSEAIMALAYGLAGWAGVVAICAAAFGSAIWILGQTVARRLEGTALAVVLLLGMSLMTPSLLARPHMLAFPLVALWATELVRSREEGRAPSLWLAPVMMIWANLHGGWAFGLALAGPFGLEALFTAEPARRLSVFLRWAVFGIVCLGAAALTPFGIEGVLLPFHLLGIKNLAGIGEWRPASFGQIEPLEVVLLVLIGFAMTRPLKLAPAMTALLVILIHLSLSQGRHQMLLGMVGPMILAGPIAAALGGPGEVGLKSRLTLVVTAFIGLALVGLRLATPLPRTDGPVSPISALAAVPAEVRNRPVLNQYGFGGYLIWSDIKPFIDSRAEIFKDEGLGQYAELADGDARVLDRVLTTGNIGWAIFAPGEKVNALLDAKPGWRRLYADRFAVVHVRQP
jgi:hypothetical protein